MAFHAHDGWWFERLRDGSVHIFHRKDGMVDGAVDRALTFDANTWCSIVASVSVGGENKGRWFSAMDFHAGKTGDREAVV